MTKEELTTDFCKSKVHYLRDRVPGTHNKLKGCHSNNPATCKACVSVIVAEFTLNGKVYAGRAIRNDLDQINSKIGRSIAFGRAFKNALRGREVSRLALDTLLMDSYKGEVSNLKASWKAFLKFDKNET